MVRIGIPIIAFGMLGVGVWKSMRRRVTFLERRHEGLLDSRKFRPWSWKQMCFCLYNVQLKRVHGKRKLVSEFYYNCSPIYVPKAAADDLRYQFNLTLDLYGAGGGGAFGRLDGFLMTIEPNVPPQCMEDNGDGTGTIKEYVCYFTIRKMGEMYFTYSSMYVPFKVRDSVFDEVNSRLGEKYRGDLDGFFIMIDDYVPYKYTEDSPDDIGYRMVKEEYQFDTFCKRHGVKMSRLLWVMNEYRREFYRRLVNCGEMREDDLL